MKKVNCLLIILHAFVGIGAMGGGMMAMLYPQGPGGMPFDALKNSPFSNYLIPGIILFKQHLFPTNIILNFTIKLEKKFPENIFIKYIGKLQRKLNQF